MGKYCLTDQIKIGKEFSNQWSNIDDVSVLSDVLFIVYVIKVCHP